jgi:hypothetical protein
MAGPKVPLNCSKRPINCSLVDALERPSLLAESFKEIGTDQMTRIGINGFGRIGRLVFRAIVEQGLLGKEVDVVALNDIVPADNLAYLLKYDSTQGRFQGEVSSKKSSSDLEADDILVVNGHEIRCLAIKQGPAALPWGKLGCEIVIESTGYLRRLKRPKDISKRALRRCSFPLLPKVKTSRCAWE